MTRATTTAAAVRSATAIQSGRSVSAPSHGISGKRPSVVFDAAWKTWAMTRLPLLACQSQV